MNKGQVSPVKNGLWNRAKVQGNLHQKSGGK